ncbi:MAG: GYF domain-containing protein [Candidatus Sumerlaeota bacterium]
MDWYYAQDGEQKGPVEEYELRQMHDAGQIQDQTLVWAEGMAEWKPYSAAVEKPAGAVSPAGAHPETSATEANQAASTAGTDAGTFQGQGMSSAQFTAAAVDINNYMTSSIIALVLSILGCCLISCFSPIPLILSIIAVVFSSQVNGLARAGDIQGAQSKANTAKILAIIAIVLAVLVLLLAIVGLIFGLASGSGMHQNFRIEHNF